MRKILTIFIGVLFSISAHAASLINDTETEKVLMELMAPIGRAADVPDGRLKIHIINSDDFNAFVMGGEDIYIYTGLLTQIKSPSALQAVIAHEMGHTIGGHMAQMSSRMEAELKRAMLIQALGIGLMVAGGNPSLGAGVLAGSSGVAQQSMLAFTRDEERIADDMGLKLLVKAKLDPDGFVQVLEQMGEMTSVLESKVNPNRINHPLTSERLNNVKTQIKNIDSDYVASNAPTKKQEEEFKLIQAKLIGYLDSPDRVASLYPNSDKSDAAIYARAIALMQAGKLEDARVGTQALISRNPDNPYFYELLGDIDYQLGYYDDSVDAYEKSLSLQDNAPQIETALALVLTERNKNGDKERAVELCKRSLLVEPAPLTYWVLAKTYEDGRSDWARAEYYHMLGDEKKAIKYAKNAMKKLDKNTPEYIKAKELVK